MGNPMYFLLFALTFFITNQGFALTGGVDDPNFLIPETVERSGFDALDYFRSLPPEAYKKVKAYTQAKEAYEKRKNRAFGQLQYEMKLARSQQVIAGVAAAGITNAALSRLISSPTTRHLLAKMGVIGGISGGLVTRRVITSLTRSIEHKIKNINMLHQLTKDELVRYVNNLQLRMRFEKIGVPRPFGNGERRVHLPKKVIRFLREFRETELSADIDAGAHLKEGLGLFIKTYIETLHTIYYLMRTASSFMWASAGISALDLPKTHRDVVETERATRRAVHP